MLNEQLVIDFLKLEAADFGNPSADFVSGRLKRIRQAVQDEQISVLTLNSYSNGGCLIRFVEVETGIAGNPAHIGLCPCGHLNHWRTDDYGLFE